MKVTIHKLELDDSHTRLVLNAEIKLSIEFIQGLYAGIDVPGDTEYIAEAVKQAIIKRAAEHE